MAQGRARVVLAAACATVLFVLSANVIAAASVVPQGVAAEAATDVTIRMESEWATRSLVFNMPPSVNPGSAQPFPVAVDGTAAAYALAGMDSGPSTAPRWCLRCSAAMCDVHDGAWRVFAGPSLGVYSLKVRTALHCPGCTTHLPTYLPHLVLAPTPWLCLLEQDAADASSEWELVKITPSTGFVCCGTGVGASVLLPALLTPHPSYSCPQTNGARSYLYKHWYYWHCGRVCRATATAHTAVGWRERRLAVSCYSSHEVRMFFNSLTEGSEWEYVQTVTLTDQSQGR